MNLIHYRIRLSILLLAAVTAVGVVLYQDPIAQNPEYHRFRDARLFFGIPNFWNVITNLAFLLVGLLGWQWLSKATPGNHLRELRPAYFFLFTGLVLISVGSGYYHLWPGNGTLVWDRIPMTIAFMALFVVIIGEFISIRAGRLLLWPLLICGVSSVIYWHFTEVRGTGDLRPYILVQFLPVLLLPLIMLLFNPVFTRTRGYWLLLGSYLLAKVLEHFDAAIFDIAPLLSGHSLKHVTAACGVFLMIEAYKRRELC